ncbi:MAG: PIN/TRAM domain-containing protein, partial [Pirellulales bacterium]|nr:PIN/TRAM domain-containing protein [Pirellulales bacterium]
HDPDLPKYAGLTVDLNLVALANHLQGKPITNDFNLNKVARLQGVVVINLNDLTNSLKLVFLPV